MQICLHTDSEQSKATLYMKEFFVEIFICSKNYRIIVHNFSAM